MKKPYLTNLAVIGHPKGQVKHGLKCTEESFSSFGEAYFTEVNEGAVKGWKKHIEMTLNLIVPVGSVTFFVRSDALKTLEKFNIGENSYQRLTVPPNYWVAFKGLSRLNLVLNIANIPHDPAESLNVPLDHFGDKNLC